MANEQVFESQSIPKTVFRMAVPTMLSMLVTIFYNMADTFFVGQTGDALQVASVSLTNPYFMLFMGVANIFGIGGSSCISRALGAGKTDKVKSIAAFCFYGTLCVSIAISVFTLIFMDRILPVLGASENTIGFAESYLTYIACGGIFISLSSAYSNLVRGEGAAKISMCGMLIGTITNIVLDPVFILVLDMGVTGAAIATVIGNFCAVVFYMIYMAVSKTQLTVNPKYLSAERDCTLDILAVGVPVFLSNILMTVSQIVYNNVLSGYGDNPVAAAGIASRVNSLVFMLQMGFALSTQPLMGYCYGSRNMKRFKEIMKFSMICTFILGSAMTLIYIIFTPQIVGLFIDDAEVISYGVTMLRAFMIAGPFIGIMFTFIYAFQAMGNASAALILSVSRQGLVYFPVLFLMNCFIGFRGIVYSQAVADIVSILIAIAMFTRINHDLERDPAFAVK